MTKKDYVLLAHVLNANDPRVKPITSPLYLWNTIFTNLADAHLRKKILRLIATSFKPHA